MSSQPQYFRPDWKGGDRNRLNGLTWVWPKWLAEPEGGQVQAARALIAVCVAYNTEQQGCEPRRLRNLLAHGIGDALDLSTIADCLKTRDLIAGVDRTLGENFLAAPLIAQLLAALNAADLTQTLRTHLAHTLTRAIED